MCPFVNSRSSRTIVATELPLGMMKKVFSRIRHEYRFSFALPTVTITGGEPFCREDMGEILRFLSVSGFPITVRTNGTLLSRSMISRIATLKDIRFSLSLDGLSDVHDRIRGYKGAFAKTTDTMRALLESGVPVGNISVNCVISDKNYETLEDFVCQIRRSHPAVDIYFEHLGFTTRNAQKQFCLVTHQYFGKVVTRDNVSVEEVQIDTRKLARIVVTIKNKYDKRIFFRPEIGEEEIHEYYYNYDSVSYAGKCRVPWRELEISPGGDVYPCGISFKIGNAVQESLKDIWGGKNMRLFRNVLAKNDFFSVCHRCCKLALK